MNPLYPLTQILGPSLSSNRVKYRLVEAPISNCMNSDIYRMFVLTQFNSASLNAHKKTRIISVFLANAFVDILGQNPDNPIFCFKGHLMQRQCMPHSLNHDFDYALILSGDQLYQNGFQRND
jgi:glucose-1-phosphate adenylyltransferase